ncbi:DNA polymerase family X [Faustovirus]|nr:hypothetical protein F-LCD7_0382 [Faustovirus]QJX72150.1 DNA polymerase family X [Faustovirus]
MRNHQQRLRDEIVESFNIAMCFVYSTIRFLMLCVIVVVILVAICDVEIKLRCDHYTHHADTICAVIRDIITYTIDTAIRLIRKID